MTVRGVEKPFPIEEGVLQRVVGRIRLVDAGALGVCRGEMPGLVGESGSGKTTLGRCVSGLTHPTAGGVHVRLPGQDRVRLDADLAVPGPGGTAEQVEALERTDATCGIDRMSRRPQPALGSSGRLPR